MSDGGWSPMDDRAVQMEAMGQLHPMRIAGIFLSALKTEPLPIETLEILVTPEGLEAWGDFTVAKDQLASIVDPGITSYMPSVDQADSDVAWYYVLSGVKEAYTVTGPTASLLGAVINLVWRPERGIWAVHSMGDRMTPSALNHVRTSPGEAPAYQRESTS